MLKDSDPDIVKMAQEELEIAKSALPEVEHQLKIMMLPKDSADSHNVIMEIRAGAGGDEAGLFAGDLLRMYQRFAELQGWKNRSVRI